MFLFLDYFCKRILRGRLTCVYKNYIGLWILCYSKVKEKLSLTTFVVGNAKIYFNDQRQNKKKMWWNRIANVTMRKYYYSEVVIFKIHNTWHIFYVNLRDTDVNNLCLLYQIPSKNMINTFFFLSRYQISSAIIT